MACEFEIIVMDPDGSRSEIAPHRNKLIDIATLAFDEIERLDRELSCFRPTSEVSFLNAEAAQRPVIVQPELFEILSTAKQVWSETDGAFDITAGPIIDLWRTAEQTGDPPSQQAIEDALANVGMCHIDLDDRTNSVRFSVPGVRINLGAIGKGYAVEKAASILRDYGVESALVTSGGSTVRAFGNGPDGDGWKVGIRHPSKLDERVTEIVLTAQAMSTSGGPAQRDRDVEEHFEHIIDPITGMPAQSAAASVTVITNDATLSDALATAFYLRGRDLADRYCAAHSEVKAVFVDRCGRTFE